MVYFLIPVFNEVENIPQLAKGMQQILADVSKHFVFVNDCSTDETEQRIHECFSGSVFTVITNKINSGPGLSFNTGFNFILEHSQDFTDVIVTIEGDNTSDLQILPLMHELVAKWKYNLVLASVYAQGGGFQQTTFLRKSISFIANQILRFRYDIKVLTLSSFYRVYDITLVRNMKDKFGVIVEESGFVCGLELLVKSIRLQAKIIEVPMVLNSNMRKGKSKMKLLKTMKAYVRYLLFK